MLCCYCIDPARVSPIIYFLELKAVFPEDDFPLNANILMVTILKMSYEITATTLPESYNISLSSADCLKNLATDISKIYIPMLE
jgi:hypothetical protein